MNSEKSIRPAENFSNRIHSRVHATLSNNKTIHFELPGIKNISGIRNVRSIIYFCVLFITSFAISIANLVVSSLIKRVAIKTFGRHGNYLFSGRLELFEKAIVLIYSMFLNESS